MDIDSVMTVLLVDEDAVFLKSFSDRFREMEDIRARIDTCATAREMRNRIYSHPYDLIFLSDTLPDAAGLDLLAELSRTSVPLPIVMTAARDAGRAAVEAIKKGALDYLLKQDLLALDLAGFLRRQAQGFHLRRENAEFRHINQMKNDFLATVSHELRTPLTSILGMSEILLSERLGRLPEKPRGAARKIQEQAQGLARVINQLLEIQDFTQDRVTLRMGPLALPGLVDRVVTELRPLFEGKKVSLRLEVECPDRTVHGDADTLHKVVENILRNALKFTLPDGAVEVRLAETETGQVLIRIKDTGCGFPPQALPYVFQKFFHADPSLARSYGGLGLGLAYCKHAVDAHGGRVWVESDGPGKGAVVNVALPREDPGAGPGGTRDGRSLLLWVDDNPTLLELIEYGFAGLSDSIALITARSGAAGLDHVRARRPDMVVLDVMMPDINGLEVLARLKTDPRTRDIPVMMVSGYREAAQEALEKGAVDCLLKPFRVSEVVDKVQRHIAASRRPAAAENRPRA
jgi:signal transduction histidine kinase